MRKYLNKAIALTMIAALSLSMTACHVTVTTTSENEKTTEAAANMENPIIESTEDEVIAQTGIDLPAPEGASDVKYFLIDQGEEEPMLAEVDFTLDGKEFFMRACSTDLTSLTNIDTENPVAIPDIEAGNISGLNYQWNTGRADLVEGREALINLSKEGAGYIAWLDVVPGILYNLAMTSDADEDTLLNTATSAFVPMQGEADGDEEVVTDANESFSTLMDTIYDTKAGSAGSEERVTAAADDVISFVQNYAENLREQDIEEMADQKFVEMEDKYGEGFKANFKECFDAVCDAVIEKDASWETDAAYLALVNGVLIVTAEE